MSSLLLKGVKATYGQGDVLHGIDLEVPDGEVTALLGANGAGKTTTLRAVCGMISTTGTIELHGEPIQGKSPERIARMGIAHVPDGRGTFARLSVLENLRLGAFAARNRKSFSSDLERVYGYFPRLKERSTQIAGTLSGGEQQMLAIGRALMAQPRVVLMDEPSFGLAPVIVKQVFEIISQIAADENVSMLLVEQNANLALKVAKTAALMEVGSIAAAGTSDELLEDDAIQRAYLGGGSSEKSKAECAA